MSAPAAGPWTVAIPAPAPWLSANQRRDLRRQTPDRRAWRDAGMVHAKRVRLPRLQYAHLVAVLRFPDNRRRDAHNYYPTLKALVDGRVDYGLLPDDSESRSHVGGIGRQHARARSLWSARVLTFGRALSGVIVAACIPDHVC